ncbi:hypothetical protein FHS83_000320 [Rhizomicrobium palustre]|uniref:Uncharacterized protein n=1 Tax=Rhizomicrobium palustre TaxID=189966 RepID=A0A846MV74_9PROT|nr:hypothetical protein [Rhizomicrobium palustre]
MAKGEEDECAYDAFLCARVELGRTEMRAGLDRINEEVEADAAIWRNEIL